MNKHILPPENVREITTAIAWSYYVVCIDYGRKGREAIVDPELTRSNIIDRIRSGEFSPESIAFIHHVTMNDVTADVKDELVNEALGMRAA